MNRFHLGNKKKILLSLTSVRLRTFDPPKPRLGGSHSNGIRVWIVVVVNHTHLFMLS